MRSLREATGCGIRASFGATGPKSHAGERRLLKGGAPHGLGRERRLASGQQSTPNPDHAWGPAHARAPGLDTPGGGRSGGFKARGPSRRAWLRALLKPNRGGSRPSARTGSLPSMEGCRRRFVRLPFGRQTTCSLHISTDPSRSTEMDANVWPCESRSWGPSLYGAKAVAENVPYKLGLQIRPISRTRASLGRSHVGSPLSGEGAPAGGHPVN